MVNLLTALRKVKTSDTYCTHNCAESVMFAVNHYTDMPTEAKDLFSISCTTTRDNIKSSTGKKYFNEVNPASAISGDIILFDWDYTGDCDHIGIIRDLTNNTITYEDFNGGNCVRTYGVHTISCTSDLIANVFRYAGTFNSDSKYKSVYDDILFYKGDKSPIIALCQYGINKILNVNMAVDMLFGNETEKYVHELQAFTNIENDGIIGTETLTAIVNELKKIK